ncbi:MAG: acyl-CoA thioesterase [Flavobacterium sp.]|uniref:acyl-CoA thioesterase n=1 Tax=Flavobacterium sp. TaxID=239 RepID=UPI0032649ACC
MKQLEKIIESKVKIRFPDCDPFNHLNNSKYIDYIINAREDQLVEFYDFDIYKLAQQEGISWVVAQNQIAYLSPATLMETVTIQTQLIFCNEKTLVLEALMWNEDKSILKAILWSKFIHFNLKTKKSEIHSEELMNLFKQIENPLNEPIAFEKRVENLRFSNTN